MTTALRRPLPGWSVLSLVLVALAGAWSAVPGGLPRSLGIVLVNALVVGALVIAVRTARPSTRRAWALLLSGQVFSTAGWAYWLALPLLTGAPLGTPNVGDVLFLIAYPLNIAGLVVLARAAGADRGSLLDGAVMGVSGAVLIWTTIAPQAAADQVPVLARVVALAYPMLDVLLVAAAVAIAVSRHRSPRALLLLGWAGLQMFGDLLYGWQVGAGSFTTDNITYGLYVAAFALLAGAALHPRSDRTFPPAVGRRRALLLLGVLPLPGVLVLRAVQGSSEQVLLAGVASLLVTLLAVLRAAQSGEALPPEAERDLRRSLLRWSAAVVLGALLPLATLTALAVAQARSTVQEELAERLRATAATSAGHTTAHLGVLKDLVASYADREAVVAVTRQATSTSRPGGQPPRAAEGLQRHLAELAGRSADHEGAWVVDTRGTVLAVSGDAQEVVGRNFAHRDYVRGVFAAGAPYASDAFVADLPGRPHLIGLAAPVRHQGRVVGALVLGYRLEGLGREVDPSARDSEAEVTLTDRQGVVLAGGVAGGGQLVSTRDLPGVRRALQGRSGVIPGDEPSGCWVAYTAVPSTGYAVVARVSAAQAARPADLFTARVVAAATLLGQLLLAGLVLLLAAERRRRAALALLSAREQETREVLQAAGDPFFSFDEQGRVRTWNRRAEEVYGWSADEAVGAALTDLVVIPDDHEAFAEDLRRTWRGGLGGSVVLQVTQRRRDGSTFPVEFTAWSTSDGVRTTHNAFARDMTNRLEHEAALARARDEALRTSRLKSEFVANMSHEIRTPLNGVVGMTTLLRRTELDGRQREFVDTLAGSADALVRVLNDVLDFSKIEAGKLDVECTDVEIAPLAREVAALFSAAAGVKELALEVVVDPALPQVLCTDGHRLRQVLANLVSNAVKFTESGSVVLEAAADGPEVDGGVPVRLTVRDTGPGIAPEQQQQLFEAFTQADTSITRTHGGTGLGLTISRRLVTLLGGELTVSSVPGAGSAFHVSLVLPRGGQAQAPAVPDPAPAAAVPAPRGRLLVAEDSPVNQLVVVEMLRMVGYEADVASDGEQAVRMLEQGDYDLVLMDCQMPVLDGFGATARIRSLPGPRSAVPVVALTASALLEDRDQCRAAGMDDFLAKPLRLDELEEVLGRTLAPADRTSGARA